MTPWTGACKNTGGGCHFLLQRIFLTQGSNPSLLYWRVDFFTTESPGKLCSSLSNINLEKQRPFLESPASSTIMGSQSGLKETRKGGMNDPNNQTFNLSTEFLQ